MTNNKTDKYSLLPKVRQISNLSFFVILKYNTIQTDFSLVYDWNTSETLELNNPSIKNDYAEGRISLWFMNIVWSKFIFHFMDKYNNFLIWIQV